MRNLQIAAAMAAFDAGVDTGSVMIQAPTSYYGLDDFERTAPRRSLKPCAFTKPTGPKHDTLRERRKVARRMKKQSRRK